MAVKVREKTDTIYRVTFKGLAKIAVGKNVSVEPYEMTVRMNEAMVQAGPLASWRNYLAPQLLPKILPYFQRVRTQEIIHAEREDGQPIDNPAVMSFEQLVEYVELAELPVDTNIYMDAGELRNAIRECRENEEAFVQSQKRLAQRRGPEVTMKQSAAELNAELVLSLNESAPGVNAEGQTFKEALAASKKEAETPKTEKGKGKGSDSAAADI